MDTRKETSLEAREIEIDPAEAGHRMLLGGPPGNVVLRAGLTEISPGAEMPQHSTGAHEELLVTLAGSGEVVLPSGTRLELSSRSLVVVPPQTEHSVVNTGESTLRYVHVLAPA